MLDQLRRRDHLEHRIVTILIVVVLAWLVVRREWVFATDGNGEFADPMMVSGFLTAFAALPLSLFIEYRFRRMLQNLLKDGIFEGGAVDVQTFETEVRRRAFKWRILTAIFIAILIAVGFINFFGWPLSGFTAEFTLASVILGAVTGHRLGTIIANGRLSKVARDQSIRLVLVPDHPDKAGGTATLGNFLMFQAILVAIVLVWLSIWLTLLPDYAGYQNWTIHLATLWLVAAGIFAAGFVYPVMSFRGQMRDARTRLSEHIGAEIERNIGHSLQRKVSANNAAEFLSANEDHVAQIKLRRAVDSLPSLPLGGLGNGLFRVTTMSVFVPPAFDLVISDESVAGGWLTTSTQLILKNIGF